MFPALTLIIVLGGFALWQADLAKDPPMYFDGLGQSLATDPPQYAFHARNEILHDKWDPFDYPRWTVYQHSLTSLAAWFWMTLTGVSRAHANMAGVLLSFGALGFLLLGLYRHHRPWLLAAVAFAFIVNINLLTHGRLSYLENGLLFWAGVLFWVYSWWGRNLWGIAAAGAIVAAAMLTGKLFGALLLPALIGSIFFDRQPNRLRHMLAAVVAFAVSTAALGFALYGRSPGDVLAYAGEQSWGLRGYPDGLASPWAFIEHLISYGFDNRLFYLSPELLLMAAVGGLLAIQYRLDQPCLPPTTRLALFWTVCGLIGLMPLNYSPVRYALLIIPAIIIFCLTMFDRTYPGRSRAAANHHRRTVVLLALLLWPVIFHLTANLFFFNTFPTPTRALVWSSGAGAAVVAWLSLHLLRRQTESANRRAWVVTLALVLAATAVVNGVRFHRFHIKERVFSMAEASADLAAILNPAAVVSGPYGPVLTFDTDLKSFIHLFQVARVDTGLFARQPVTHLLLDVSNYSEAVRNYPRLAGLTPAARYWIRDVEVGLYRISGLFGNPEAAAYRVSPYEEAAALHQSGDFDSALAVLSPFASTHPESKSARMLLAELYLRAGHPEIARARLLELTERFSGDFYVQLQTGRFLLAVALQTQDRPLFSVARTYFERAVAVNPYRARYAMDIYAQTTAQFANPDAPPR